MKKRIIAIALVGALAVSLAGCGSSSGSSDSASTGDSSASGEVVADEDLSGTLTIWEHDYSFEDALSDLCDAFMEKYPNVEVDYEIKSSGDYYSVLSQAIQSNDGPDLFWTNGTATVNMEDYAENGALEDLTDLVDYSFISDSAMDLAEVDGSYYSVPWMTLDTRTVFYNKDMFEENGWEVPTTFSEFEDLLATIKASGITPISMALDEWCLLFCFEPMLAGYDADYSASLQDYEDGGVNATDQTVRDCMQKLVDWADAGYFGDNWTGVIDNDSQILAFTTGAAAMDIAGSWDSETIAGNNPALNFGAFTIPAEDGTCGLVGTSSNGFSISAKSQNMDAAIAFANFCASEEGQTIWVQTTGAVSATDEIEASSEVAQEITASGQGNTYRSWQNVLSQCSSTGDASTIWGNDFTKIFTGEMTVDELCDEIDAEM